MAIQLDPGELEVRLQYARDLKDGDWFGQQDPYVILQCGRVKYRSNTIEGGGRHPSWNQVFTFKVDQETSIEVKVYDEDFLKMDDCLGTGEVDIVSVRLMPDSKKDVQIPLFRRISRRQQGHLHLTLSFRATAVKEAASDARPSNTGVGAATTAVHKGHAGLAAAAVAALAAHNSPADAYWSRSNGGAGNTAATGYAPAEGSTLPAGLVPAGSFPDAVPVFEPTCGLIQPQTHQPLPGYQTAQPPGALSAAYPAAPPPPLPSAPPLPPQGPAAYPTPLTSFAPGAHTVSYPSMASDNVYHIGGSFAVPAARPAPYPAHVPQMYSQQPYGAPYPPPAYYMAAPQPQPVASFAGMPLAPSYDTTQLPYAYSGFPAGAPPPYAPHNVPPPPPGVNYMPPSYMHA